MLCARPTRGLARGASRRRAPRALPSSTPRPHHPPSQPCCQPTSSAPPPSPPSARPRASPRGGESSPARGAPRRASAPPRAPRWRGWRGWRRGAPPPPAAAAPCSRPPRPTRRPAHARWVATLWGLRDPGYSRQGSAGCAGQGRVGFTAGQGRGRAYTRVYSRPQALRQRQKSHLSARTSARPIWAHLGPSRAISGHLAPTGLNRTSES